MFPVGESSQAGTQVPSPLLSFPKEVPSVGEAPLRAPSKSRLVLLARAWLILPFSVFGLSPSPTPPQDAHGSLETEQRAACSGMGMVVDRCPEFPLEKEGWVCLVRAHTLWFIKVLYTMCPCLRPDLQGSEIFLGVCVLDVCLCVGVGRVASQPAMEGIVAVGSRLPEKMHSRLLASCFPGSVRALRTANLSAGDQSCRLAG